MDNAEHRHYFKPRISRSDNPPYWETIAGYEPCECGMTHGASLASLRDPIANVKAAKRLFAESQPWVR